MKYLHTMVRVTDLDASLDFYCNKLGLRELSRKESEKGRFTLIFLAAPGDESAQVELTYNWDPQPYTIGRAFGHLPCDLGGRLGHAIAREQRHADPIVTSRGFDSPCLAGASSFPTPRPAVCSWLQVVYVSTRKRSRLSRTQAIVSSSASSRE